MIAIGCLASTLSAQIYFLDNSVGVRRADLDGSNLTTLVSQPSGGPHTLVVNKTNNKLYWSSLQGTISRADIDGSNSTTIFSGATSVRGISVDQVNGHIYYALPTTSGGSIRRINIDGTNDQSIATGLGPVIGLAVDPWNSHIYWTNIISDNINRINFNGSGNIELVAAASGLVNDPRFITLDLAAGLMYWTNSSPLLDTLVRANLDGSSGANLVSGSNLDLATGISVQKSGGKIYWADSNSGAPFISRANLSDGSNVETLLSSPSITNPFGLVVIPEPSTYALLAGALGLGLAIFTKLRRRLK